MKEATKSSKKCKKCGEPVAFGGMREHWTVKHPDEPLPLHLKYQKQVGSNCPECGKRFNSPQAMTWHRKREHGVVAKLGKAQPTRRVTPDESHTLNYCPRCGCDLEAVQVALNFKRA